MKNWEPVDIGVLIIIAIVGVILIISIIRPFITDKTMSVDAAKLVAGIIGSLISIVSVWVGSRTNKKE